MEAGGRCVLCARQGADRGRENWQSCMWMSCERVGRRLDINNQSLAQKEREVRAACPPQLSSKQRHARQGTGAAESARK